MAGGIVDLGKVARDAQLRAEGKPVPIPADQHPAWPPFIAQMNEIRKQGRQIVKKTFDTLWLGYRNGYEEAIRNVSASFKAGNFTMEGHAPSYWVELKRLAAEVAAPSDEATAEAARVALYSYLEENESVAVDAAPSDLSLDDLTEDLGEEAEIRTAAGESAAERASE